MHKNKIELDCLPNHNLYFEIIIFIYVFLQKSKLLKILNYFYDSFVHKNNQVICFKSNNKVKIFFSIRTYFQLLINI